MSAVIDLDAKLDFQSIAPLIDRINAAPAGDIAFDASHVSHLGAQALQVILATVRLRAEAGAACTMRNITDACVDQLSLFGFTPESLCTPEAWT